MSDIKNILNLFCLSVKVFFVLLILIVIYYYNAYSIWGTAYFVIALLTLLTNMYLYLKDVFLCRKSFLIYLDFFLIGLGFLFSSQLMDTFPPLLLLLLYTFSHLKATLILLVLNLLIIFTKTFYGFFSERDIIPTIFFILSFYTLATRWDILMFIRYKKLDSLSLKAKYQKLQRDLAFFSKRTKWLEEYESVINKLSKLKAREETEKVLENLLSAERIKIIPKKLKHTETLSDNVVIDLNDIIVLIKPKGKYLLKDRDFKNKMEILFKLIKPYLESFLANRR